MLVIKSIELTLLNGLISLQVDFNLKLWGADYPDIITVRKI